MHFFETGGRQSPLGRYGANIRCGTDFRAPLTIALERKGLLRWNAKGYCVGTRRDIALERKGLTQIFEISGFCCPTGSIFPTGCIFQPQEFLDWSGIVTFTRGVMGNTIINLDFSMFLRFCLVIGMCIVYS